MKKKFNFSIILLFILLIGVTSFASNYSETIIRHYNNIKIKLNDKEIVPKDVNGKFVEPFIIDGTTYLPIRAIGDALGLSVAWDSTNNTVILNSITMNKEDTESDYFKAPVNPNNYAEVVANEKDNNNISNQNNTPIMPSSNATTSQNKDYYKNYVTNSIKEKMNANGLLDSSITQNSINTALEEIDNSSVNKLESVVYHTYGNSYFHNMGCKFLTGTLNSDVRYKAIAKGLKACLVCNP